ncbi:MAG: DUF3427 domain-containing protein, partial [Bacilli bacterium]|nr:DUF3427 domain-containing protein [Bacilli bacterium]
KVIFTVDLFNEGIDIPSVNTILMLRPTDSSIIFIQQLGRGLRKLPDKEFVTVLDFIGNYNKSFLMAIALNGKQNFDKDSLKVEVETDFADLPNGTYIHMDKITKQQILQQLENERFMSMKYMKESYLNFKHICGGKVPKLIDYLKHDGSVDPLRFSTFSPNYKSYIEFVAYMEKESHPEYQLLLNNESYKTFIRFINFFMPFYKLEEICSIKCLIEKCLSENDFFAKISLNEAMTSSCKYFENCNKDNFLYAFELLAGNHLGKPEIQSYKNGFLNIHDSCISFNKDIATFFSTRVELSLIAVNHLLDLIEYSILRFEDEFGIQKDIFPFLKLYNKYYKRDVTHLCQTSNLFAPMRGIVKLTNNAYYIFVNLHKDADIKESINYKDKFITQNVFQWQSPNDTSQDSDQGKDIIFSTKRKIDLHLFVRKFETEDGVNQPFTYFGKLIPHSDSAEGNKPITILFTLENTVPDDIYLDFTTRTDMLGKISKE